MDSKLRTVLAEVLGIPPESIDERTSPDTEAAWDSLRHMNLVFALEDAFDVRFSDDDIANLTSVPGIEAALRARQS